MNNTQGGFGAMFNGIADGYMTGISMQKAMAEQQKQQQDEIERRQQEAEAKRVAESERQRQQMQQQGGTTPQQTGGGMDPSSLMSLGSTFMSNGSAAGGTAAGGSAAAGGAGGGTAAGGAAAGGSAAGGAAGGSSALGGAAAAAGPWAALAAIIATNEISARNSGARRDGFQYWKDLGTGKVVEQDVNQRIVPKIFGGYNDDKTGLAHEAGAAGEFSTLDFKNGAKKLENGVVGNLIKKIF